MACAGAAEAVVSDDDSIDRPWNTAAITRLLALGSSCECTYQLRRFSGVERASYFDWLGVPHEALIRVLEGRFRNCFERHNLGISNDGRTVLDLATGLSYRHAFRWLPGTTSIDPESLNRDYVEQRDKYAMLAQRWFSDLESQNVLFVRQDSISSLQAERLLTSLQRHSVNPVYLLFIIPLTDPIPNVVSRQIRFEKMDHSPPHSGWQGADYQWDTILAKYASGLSLSGTRPVVARELTAAESKVRAKSG